MIEYVVGHVAGEDVIPLVAYLKNKKNISEFIIADELDTEINKIRNMLYRLQQANLVSFTRKKDKIKGWYVYYWTFDPHKIQGMTEKIKKDLTERLKDRLKREEASVFYKCPNLCIRLDFDQAIGFNLKCPECGEILNQEDNTQEIQNLKVRIVELEEENQVKSSG